MQKKISNDELVHKISSAAYLFKELGYYGSKEKAIKALLKRKGFEGCSLHKLTSQFEQALKVISDAGEFVEKELPQKTLVNIERKEVDRFINTLRETLKDKNPHVPQEMIRFALNWIYTNYYLR